MTSLNAALDAATLDASENEPEAENDAPDNDKETIEESDDKDTEQAAAPAVDANAVREAEQARCQAILTSPAGQRMPNTASHCAFKTTLSAADAVALLDVAAKDSASAGFQAEMEADGNPDLGTGATASSEDPADAALMAAANRRARKPLT
ncbi:MAG: hypothetical protein AAGL24_10005 [Pseudomonadota bacterium]